MHQDLSSVSGVVAIVPAAGVGSRMGTDVPKQYLKLNNKTILDITLDKLLKFEPISLVVLVISPQDSHYTKLENIEHKNIVVIEGGEERSNSVHNALRYLFDSGLADDVPVMVHDAARPCITHEDLEKLYQSFQADQQACLLAAPVIDTLQSITPEKQVVNVVERDHLVRAFTPQMARFIDLNNSLGKAIDNRNMVTDEVSALTLSGHPVRVVLGRSDNIKITNTEDLPLAEFYLNKYENS
ncbi:2-C-methyl-D-erythritol 4-phosphate cytidylyltransferase [Aliikangiella coralliicola]|uniref:2-C-methyl-D-erythritol 4-phosphate cytidylyltransferase n=1 Tax=Aliikangiella coralliicola TaxID=2592383 RepID=A0A545TSU8_9GAMM|nr:2-C-methyl-D-erythritol 4-phosphate cytidylyltransferase [Aliikangiella coralliicola]TQV80303.1 2-C-methyl-D-erythritol 4-phosphate cytidylyltransferase [Aliikangiella coralliicola]